MARDPALQARLEVLRRGERPFAGAYEALLCGGACRAACRRCSPSSQRSGPRRRPAFGASAHRRRLRGDRRRGRDLRRRRDCGLPRRRRCGRAEPPGWRQVVAEYQTLTTAETLAAIPDNAAAVSQELGSTRRRLALDLAPDKLVLPHVDLKRAQMFEFRGRPLVQIAYLSPADGPDRLLHHRQRPARRRPRLRAARGLQHRLLDEGRPRLHADRQGAARAAGSLRRRACGEVRVICPGDCALTQTRQRPAPHFRFALGKSATEALIRPGSRPRPR